MVVDLAHEVGTALEIDLAPAPAPADPDPGRSAPDQHQTQLIGVFGVARMVDIGGRVLPTVGSSVPRAIRLGFLVSPLRLGPRTAEVAGAIQGDRATVRETADGAYWQAALTVKRLQPLLPLDPNSSARLMLKFG